MSSKGTWGVSPEHFICLRQDSLGVGNWKISLGCLFPVSQGLRIGPPTPRHPGTSRCPGVLLQNELLGASWGAALVLACRSPITPFPLAAAPTWGAWPPCHHLPELPPNLAWAGWAASLCGWTPTTVGHTPPTKLTSSDLIVQGASVACLCVILSLIL